ncbi:hypothetical protein ig2599ANME_1542 [groundwater metagenome]
MTNTKNIKKYNCDQINLINANNDAKNDLSDVINTITLTSSISSLSSLANETLEFSTIKNRNLLKNYEKI